MKNYKTPHFRKTALFVSFLFSGIIFSQNISVDPYNSINKNNKGVKKMIVKLNDTIKEEHFFDKTGMPYLLKENSFSVKYYKYDKKNRIIIRIQGDIIRGFSCQEIKYFKNKTEVFSYLTEDEKNLQIENDQYLKNKANGIQYTIVGNDTISIDDAYAVVTSDEEYYKYAKEITSIQDTTSMFNSFAFKNLMKEPKYMSFKADYDSKLRPLNEKYFDSRNKITSDRKFSYSGNTINITYKVDMIGTGEIVQTLDSSGNILTEVEKQKVINYKYDKGICIEKKEFQNNVLLNVASHLYKDDLLQQDIYDDIQNGGKFITDYVYDSSKRIIQITNSSNYSKHVYQYTYEYY
ncbi:hypothetical protein [Flavobacterium ginsenosidimutans]|uniref:hypothetical protein n=1 Tax=Flavobacterium ginsenosidimutans TaxID=687844 RepID=UPI000DAC3BB1|nr:hypothetical protein [Flavobacterium ginsenosidimutans]KAF2336770.1 hypothetical protein DM444_03320 [Flavobacterium ginsenosidimutans]